MAEIIKESVTTQNEGPKEAVTTETKRVATSSQTVEYLIYFFFGALEILLAFRLVLEVDGSKYCKWFCGFDLWFNRNFYLTF